MTSITRLEEEKLLKYFTNLENEKKKRSRKGMLRENGEEIDQGIKNRKFYPVANEIS